MDEWKNNPKMLYQDCTRLYRLEHSHKKHHETWKNKNQQILQFTTNLYRTDQSTISTCTQSHQRTVTTGSSHQLPPAKPKTEGLRQCIALIAPVLEYDTSPANTPPRWWRVGQYDAYVPFYSCLPGLACETAHRMPWPSHGKKNSSKRGTRASKWARGEGGSLI